MVNNVLPKLKKSKQFIKQLDTLNNAQNNYLTNEINKSDNIKDITNIVDNASSLNDAMKDLRIPLHN